MTITLITHPFHLKLTSFLNNQMDPPTIISNLLAKNKSMIRASPPSLLDLPRWHVDMMIMMIITVVA